MSYLAEKSLVHRDLAARNVLVKLQLLPLRQTSSGLTPFLGGQPVRSQGGRLWLGSGGELHG